MNNFMKYISLEKHTYPPTSKVIWVICSMAWPSFEEVIIAVLKSFLKSLSCKSVGKKSIMCHLTNMDLQVEMNALINLSR